MADTTTKPEETVKQDDVVQTPPAPAAADPVPEPVAETAPAPAAPVTAPQEGQIDHKFFKRIQWGLTAATAFCAAAGFTAAHFEQKERQQSAPSGTVAPAVTAKPITPLVAAPN